MFYTYTEIWYDIETCCNVIHQGAFVHSTLLFAESLSVRPCSWWLYVLYSAAVIASTSLFRRDRFDEAIAFFGSSLLYSRESGATCFDVDLLWVKVSLYKAVMLTRPQGSRPRPRLNNTGIKLKLRGSFQKINKNKEINKKQSTWQLNN